MISQKNNQNGFTLVELAIALMVIGLLIGGVLKGQELIENARVTATIRQFNAYETAIMIFRNSYGALPGDFKRPNRIPNCTDETLCTTPGNGNGRIDEIAEGANFFPHMTKAGVIQGPEGGSDAEYTTAKSDESAPERDLFWPTLPLDGIKILGLEYMVINDGSLSVTGNHYIWRTDDSSSASAINQLDTKIDDGSACRGDMISKTVGSGLCTEDPTSDYTEIFQSSTRDVFLRF